MALNSRNIFLEVFAKIVPYGDYYKKKDAVNIVNKNVSYKIPKQKMLKLLELIPKKKSLYKAQKDMNDRNFDKIMEKFAELNLSPITISKRQLSIKHLKSLYWYLL